jgi:hypothetical protein
LIVRCKDFFLAGALPVFDAAISATFHCLQTTGFRRLEKWRTGQPAVAKNNPRNEASKTGSWKTEKHRRDGMTSRRRKRVVGKIFHPA